MPKLRITPAVTAAAVSLLATGLAAAPAGAAAGATGTTATTATVSADWDSQSISYLAGDGQVNDLYVTEMGPGTEGRRIGFNDEVPIQAGDHCSYLEPEDDTFVVCELPTTSTLPDAIHVFLGDGDDGIFTSDPGAFAVHGGPGDDELHAHTAHAVLGGKGDDMVMGGVVMHGGDGMDHVMGDDRDQELWGGPGADHVEAFGGADVVYANRGADHVTGGQGDDTLAGGRGDDMLHGNRGADTLLGGPGTDHLAGGPGADSVTQ